MNEMRMVLFKVLFPSATDLLFSQLSFSFCPSALVVRRFAEQRLQQCLQTHRDQFADNNTYQQRLFYHRRRRLRVVNECSQTK